MPKFHFHLRQNSINKGPLVPNGDIAHWIEIESVNPLTQEVKIFNPMEGASQDYSYDQLIEAWKDDGTHKIDDYLAVIRDLP